MPAAGRDRVVAGLAVERVVAEISDHVVAEDVAGAVDVAGAGQDQAFDVRPKRVARRARHEVVRSGGCTGGLDDDVEGAVDDVGVVAVAADERVVAELAVEIIVADAARDEIGSGAAHQHVAAGPAIDNVVAAAAGEHVDAAASLGPSGLPATEALQSRQSYLLRHAWRNSVSHSIVRSRRASIAAPLLCLSN